MAGVQNLWVDLVMAKLHSPVNRSVIGQGKIEVQYKKWFLPQIKFLFSSTSCGTNTSRTAVNMRLQIRGERTIMKLLVLSLVVALLAKAAPTKASERAACTTKSQRKAWFVQTSLRIY